MGVFDNFPYTNIHDLNTDWLVKTVKEVKDKTDEIDQAVINAKNSEDNAKISEENASASAEECAEKLNIIQNELTDWEEDSQNLRNQVNANTSNIAVNSGRIDAIISGGSADPDAELVDIRIGAYGHPYDSAGNSVRGQIKNVQQQVGNYMEFQLSEFGTGKFFPYVGLGNTYTTTDNAGSYYTVQPIDVSAFKGGKVKIYKDNDPTSSGRGTGFIDSNDKWTSYTMESDLPTVYQDGLYVVELPITDDYFLASFTTANTVIYMEFYKPFVDKDDIEKIEKYVMLKPNIDILPKHYVIQNTNRIKGDSYPLDDTITLISVSNPAGFNTALFVNWNSSNEMSPTGWKSTDWTFDYHGQYEGTYNYWYILGKKTDGTAINTTELNDYINNITVSVTYKTVADVIADNETAYVSPTGDDTNTGKSRNNAFASIQKAIYSGAKTILVKEGTYSGFTVQNTDNVKILIDRYYDTYTEEDPEDKPKIIIDGANLVSNGVTIMNCSNCIFENIEVKDTTTTGFYITRSSDLLFTECVAHDIGINSSGSIGGFMITYTDAEFIRCVAYNIGTTTAGSRQYHYDGFNIHGSGTTVFTDCSAWNCEDDGISHHDNCVGTVIGGEWYNCGKGGIATPTHGAFVNIYNVYCHDNDYGLYIVKDGVSPSTRILLNNSLIKNNRVDIRIVKYNVTAWNNVYDTKYISGGSLVEY